MLSKMVLLLRSFHTRVVPRTTIESGVERHQPRAGVLPSSPKLLSEKLIRPLKSIISRLKATLQAVTTMITTTDMI